LAWVIKENILTSFTSFHYQQAVNAA